MREEYPAGWIETDRRSSLIGLSGAVAALTSFSIRPFASFSSSARTIRIVDLLFRIPSLLDVGAEVGSEPRGADSRARTGSSSSTASATIGKAWLTATGAACGAADEVEAAVADEAAGSCTPSTSTIPALRLHRRKFSHDCRFDMYRHSSHSPTARSGSSARVEIRAGKGPVVNQGCARMSDKVGRSEGFGRRIHEMRSTASSESLWLSGKVYELSRIFLIRSARAQSVLLGFLGGGQSERLLIDGLDVLCLERWPPDQEGVADGSAGQQFRLRTRRQGTHRMTPMLQMSTSKECPPCWSKRISGAM